MCKYPQGLNRRLWPGADPLDPGCTESCRQALCLPGQCTITPRVRLRSVVARIAEHGGPAFAVQADMSQAADVVRLFDTVRTGFSTLDCLIQSTG